MRLLIVCLALGTTVPANAEPPRGVELFGTIGALRGGGDEGSAGSAVAYGGVATTPFARRWAVDVQGLTSRLSRSPEYSLRRVLLSPAVQYRRGNARALWFVAVGPGWQRDRARGTFEASDPGGGTRTVTYEDTQSGLTVHWRTGGVFRLSGRLLLRGEFFWANRYVLPNVGVAASLGIRLGP